ncbi:MAG: hypothetical protein HY287_02765 [Planctomycetes bacterium]|nr:hypothetical protein [Planctomycetota bacterium]MBI3833233.1 hypothetical protein [Planctomycetota bacterium]
MLDRKPIPAFLTLFAYVAYVCAPILHESFERTDSGRAVVDSSGDSVVTQGCPDPCDDPTHDHRVHDPDRCPHCQLIATSTAITQHAMVVVAGDDVCICCIHSDFQMTHANWIDVSDPIRGPPQT